MPVHSALASAILVGRTAVVTGGGSGIGLAISRELLHLGCSVVIAGRNIDRLQAALPLLQQDACHGAQVIAQPCNIRKELEVRELMSVALKRFQRLDFLVNNGGGQFPSKLEDISLKGWNAVIETNLTGTFLCMREAYNQWMSEHQGVVVNIVMDNKKGFPGMAHSGAARAGVENLTKSLAIEWAENGVRVNCIAPGIIYSDSAVANYGPAGPELFEGARRSTPAKRLGSPEEISALTVFLCTPAAGFITGQTIYVDGGCSLYRHQSWTVPEHTRAPAQWVWPSLASKL